VIALYAELDEKADHLRRADEIKSKFLSNMSHEFRTPLNSILALSRLLADHTDGELTFEQDKQVAFIRRAAEDLSELVNDLLDLAKVEAGKIVIRPAEFEVTNLLSALRGMLRPLLLNEHVNLIVQEPEGLPTLLSDEAKISQILRNFISNALKFTERGEVRVSAGLTEDGTRIVFAVADTGIGIAPEDQQRIFQEFAQVENPIQKRVRGTGLGLPLSKKLAELLGGTIYLESQPGVGSTFYLNLPLGYFEPKSPYATPESEVLNPSRIPVLVIEDNPQDILLYERFLAESDYQLLVAENPRRARDLLKSAQPQVIVLDVMLQQEAMWGFLAELKTDAATKHIPVLVVSTQDDRQKGVGLGADGYAVKPIERIWLLERLAALVHRQHYPTILLIEDEEAYRYVLRRYLSNAPYEIAEAANASEGLRLARQLRPQLILLDLQLPDFSGAELLSLLRTDELTRDIPVVVVTSKRLEMHEYEPLRHQTLAILTKTNLEPQQLLNLLSRATFASENELVH
jgi:CheY-like chemotaxis protein/two-component sensor histidine kinase